MGANAKLDFNGNAVTTAATSLNASGALTMEVTKSGGNFTGSKLTQSSGTLTYGGTFNLTASGSALAASDSITLFSPTVGSWFGTVNLPALSSGLAWDTNGLAAAGTLDVYSFSIDTLSFAAAVGKTATIPAAKLASRLHSSKNLATYPGSTWLATAPATTSLGSASINGSGNLIYTPTGAGSDTFNVTFYDGHGWQTMSLTATVAAANVGPSLSGGDDGTGHYKITTSGVPTATYNVQASTLDSGVWSSWATIATGITADQYGEVTWTDSEAISAHGGKMYRLAQ